MKRYLCAWLWPRWIHLQHCRLKRKIWLEHVWAEMNGTLLTAIAVFLVIGMHFESHLPDRQGQLNYFLIDHSFPLFSPYAVKLNKAWISIIHNAASFKHTYQLLFPFHLKDRWYPAHRSVHGKRLVGKWKCDKLQTDKFLQRPIPPSSPTFHGGW